MAVSSLKANQIRQAIDHIAAQNGEGPKPSLKPEGEEINLAPPIIGIVAAVQLFCAQD